LAVEVEIQSRADQGHAAEPGQRRASQPSQRREAPLVAVKPIVTQSYRRLDSEVGADRRAVTTGAQPRKRSRKGRQNSCFARF
jgi:hypothetical protein